MLGFYPGVIYSPSTLSTRNSVQKVEHKAELPYLLRYNGNAISHEDTLYYPPYLLGYGKEHYFSHFNKLNSAPIEILPEDLNPYAIAHQINHPPRNTPANICFIDLEIPTAFFPSSLLRYFPYMHYHYEDESLFKAAKEKTMHIVVAVALEDIKNGDELYVNYGTDRFAGNFQPAWLTEPLNNSHLSKYLNKEDALYDFSRLNKMLIRWDNMASTAYESIEKERQRLYEERLKASLEKPEVFKDYYKK